LVLFPMISAPYIHIDFFLILPWAGFLLYFRELFQQRIGCGHPRPPAPRFSLYNHPRRPVKAAL